MPGLWVILSSIISTRTTLSLDYTPIPTPRSSAYLDKGGTLGGGKDLHLAVLPGPDDGGVGLQVEVFLGLDVDLALHHLGRGRKARCDVTARDGVHGGKVGLLGYGFLHHRASPSLPKETVTGRIGMINNGSNIANVLVAYLVIACTRILYRVYSAREKNVHTCWVHI